MNDTFNTIKSHWSRLFDQIESEEPFSKLTEGPLTLSEYASLMRQIFHHARENPQIQALAAVRFRGTQRQCVKAFFKHATSEIGHDELALNDVRALGWDTTRIPVERPLPETTALLAFPYFQIEHLDPIGYLGYLFHLEFMPTRSGAQILHTLNSIGAPAEAVTFITDHATIDVGHNKLMEMYIEKMVLTQEDLETVIHAMEVTAQLYTRMIAAAFAAAEQRVFLESPREKLGRGALI